MSQRKNPPMGWNSFDCFGSTVTEAEVLANAEFVAAHLKPFGWDHIVVDYCWSHPNPPACTNPNQMHEFQPYLEMDHDFRLLPSPTRFPSAAGGAGFGPLAEKIHAMGLKFGIHIMRGFPRQAFYPGYPAQTLGYRPPEFADQEDTCPWLNHMFGVRAGTEAGQAYYDSIFKLYASWGVDFVKADDLSFPYRRAEIEAVDAARKKAGRAMTLSLSPGPCPVKEAEHVAQHAELWRISADFWDDWKKLREMFRYCGQWARHRSEGAWPDADMIPIGRLSKRGPVGPEHESFLTTDEQRLLMTLWCLFRSPLFLGGNLPDMGSETLALFTNREVLDVHANGNGACPVFDEEYPDIWVSPWREAGVIYVGVFNLSDAPIRRTVKWVEIGCEVAPRSVRELWTGRDETPIGDGITVELPRHAAVLLALRI